MIRMGGYNVPNRREWWQTGKNFYLNGIASIEDIHKAVRSMNYYLLAGDSNQYLDPVSDGDARAEQILSVIDDSGLGLTENQRAKVAKDVMDCCGWDPDDRGPKGKKGKNGKKGKKGTEGTKNR